MSAILGIDFKMKFPFIYKTEIDSQAENKLMVTKGDSGGGGGA